MRFCLFFLALMPLAAAAAELEKFKFTEPHLGTIVELTLYAPNESVANEGAVSAFARIKELDRIFSDYKPDSEAMRLCETAGQGLPTKVSSELFDVLQRSLEVSERSDGAFDVTVGPLVKLWRQARKEKNLPPAAKIATARELVGWKLVSLNQDHRSVVLKKHGMRLDFGGIAKGYIAQEVIRTLHDRGIERALIAVAGDIVAGDPPPECEGWKVGIAPLDRPDGPPSRLIQLTNCAISTSGDAFQFVEIEGTRYSHIVDPQTGIGLTNRSSVTIIADDGATADALATAVCVLGIERGLKLIESWDSAEALIVRATETGIEVTESNHFGRARLRPSR